MQNIRVEVTDKDGWHKDYVLQKVINHVGVDARNDVVLDATHGSGVSARHLQIIVSGDTCRVVNVGNTDITLATGFDPLTTAPTQIRPLTQLSSTDVIYGAWIKLGDFTLRMRLPDQAASGGSWQAPAAVGETSAVPAYSAVASTVAPFVSAGATQSPPLSTNLNTATAASLASSGQPVGPDVPIGDQIGLRLKLDQTALKIDEPLEGSVVVRNSGTRPGAQFRIEVVGLDQECYEIGAGPVLFPNAEREVAFRFMHSKKSKPKAGDLKVIIRATAPDAYPGQVAVVSQVIQVEPFYQQELKLTALD